MVKLRLFKMRPKGLIAVVLSSALLVGLTTACDDDPEENTIGDILYIDGPGSVAPESTATYTAGEFGGTISWSVDGNATLGTTEGLTAEVTFTGVGSATVMASGNGFSGSYDVTVKSIEAILTDPEGIVMDKGVVNDGGTDEVTFNFEAPLVSAPTLTITSGSATVGEVTGSGATWKATVTGSATDGDLVGQLSNVIVSDLYGGATSDSIGVALQAVDNVAPIISWFETSKTDVQDADSVVVSVTLNESAGATADSIYVDFVYSSGSTGRFGLSGSGSTWSSQHYVESGEHVVTFTLDKTTVTDLAGNALTDFGAVWTAATTIDNIAPMPTLTAVEEGTTKVLTITTSSENVQWIQLPDNSQFEPESIADFEGEGKGSVSFVESPGTYKIYYIEQDAAGNTSEISLLEDVVIAE